MLKPLTLTLTSALALALAAPAAAKILPGKGGAKNVDRKSTRLNSSHT